MKENKLVDLSMDFTIKISQKYWVAAAKGKNGNHNASYKMQL